MKIIDIYKLLDKNFPFSLQVEWDNSGIQVGDPDSKVKGILITLDIDEKSIEKAVEIGFNTIISHHPLILKGMKSINKKDFTGALLYKAIENKINIISAHTNVDIAPKGLADKLCMLLEFETERPLTEEGFGRICKVEAVKIEDLIAKIQEALKINQIRVTKGKKSILNTIAVCPGSGGDLVKDVVLNGSIDAFITGDVKYHQAKTAEDRVWIIDIGHYGSEIIFVDLIEEVLKNTGLPLATFKNSNPLNLWRTE